MRYVVCIGRFLLFILPFCAFVDADNFEPDEPIKKAAVLDKWEGEDEEEDVKVGSARRPGLGAARQPELGCDRRQAVGVRPAECSPSLTGRTA